MEQSENDERNEDRNEEDERKKGEIEATAISTIEEREPEEVIDFDRETFMTIPIFSGLMVTTLMLIILAIGVNAISEIKSNSRFDDPKGKALVIPMEG